MTCKDCVHYVRCQKLSDSENLMLKHKIDLIPCEDFKNKADFAEVKHARWEERKIEYMLYGCSYCDCRVDYEFNYCPNCGARMDGGTNNE